MKTVQFENKKNIFKLPDHDNIVLLSAVYKGLENEHIMQRHLINLKNLLLCSQNRQLVLYGSETKNCNSSPIYKMNTNIKFYNKRKSVTMGVNSYMAMG